MAEGRFGPVVWPAVGARVVVRAEMSPSVVALSDGRRAEWLGDVPDIEVCCVPSVLVSTLLPVMELRWVHVSDLCVESGLVRVRRDADQARLAVIGARMAELCGELVELSAERRAIVRELHRQGASHAQIAAIAGVARSRIHQIIHARRGGPAP